MQAQALNVEADLLEGLAVGADDYLTKPFSSRELVARVHAILRRAGTNAQGAPIQLGRIELDPPSRRVSVAGAQVHLTPTEFDLFAYLAARPRSVVTREQLLADVWGYPDGSGARTVDSHVRALRRKLGDDVIRTVHGVVYAAHDSDDDDEPT